MNVSLIISIVALFISLGSFGFSLFQFSKNRNVRKLEEVNRIINRALELERKHYKLSLILKYESDMEDWKDRLDDIGTLEELGKDTIAVLNKKSVSLEDIYKAEQALLKIELEFDLLHETLLKMNDLSKKLKQAKL